MGCQYETIAILSAIQVPPAEMGERQCCHLPLLLRHPYVKGRLQPEQVQDITTGSVFGEERLEEPGLFGLAEQRLRRDVITAYRHQRLRKYKEELLRLRHHFGTITNAYNKVTVNTVRLGVRGRFQNREIPCH